MNVYVLILLMMLVTFIPRLLPFVLIREEMIPEPVHRVLKNIPYAALGALIIPGGLQALPGHWVLSLLGLALAAGLAWFQESILVTMGVTVLALFFLL